MSENILKLHATLSDGKTLDWTCEIQLSTLINNINMFCQNIKNELRVLGREQIYLKNSSEITLEVDVECNDMIKTFSKNIPVNNIEKIANKIDDVAYDISCEIAREIAFIVVCAQGTSE